MEVLIHCDAIWELRLCIQSWISHLFPNSKTTVNPRYTVVHYNTESDIIRLDPAPRFMESTTEHFYVKWHEITAIAYVLFIAIRNHILCIKDLCFDHIVSVAAFIWKIFTISGGWISPIQHGCYFLCNFAHTFYFPHKRWGNIYV